LCGFPAEYTWEEKPSTITEIDVSATSNTTESVTAATTGDTGTDIY